MSGGETIAGLGARSDYVATVPHADPVRLRLSAEESQVFAQVGRAAQIQEILRRSGFSEPRTIALLLALRAKGAIVPARVTRPEAAQGVVSAAMEEEVDLDPARKKEILELEAQLDQVDYFALLGLSSAASPEEAKQAYYQASRRFHPDRFFGKNLGSFRARVERIFRRLSEAQQTLTDPKRRGEYLKEHPELSAPSATRPAPSRRPTSDSAVPPPEPPRPRTPEDEVREAERRARFARHPYLARGSQLHELITRARAKMEKGEFGQAVSDLQLAAQIDDRDSQVKGLLAEARRKHESRRGQDEMQKGAEAEQMGDLQAALAAYRAAASTDPQNGSAAFAAARVMNRLGLDPREAKALAQRAVELDPRRAGYRVLLGKLLEDLGMKSSAKRQFEEALKLDPGHLEAKKHLKKRWPF